MKINTYAGIPEEFGILENAKIVLIPVPYDGTSTWQKGADKGPEAFLNASENMELYDIETETEVYKQGVYLADAVTENSSPEAMVSAVHTVTKRFIKKKKFVTIFGGEHSISIGTIRAFNECYNNLTVLQLDAHADLRKSYEGSNCNHACAVYEASQTTNLLQVGIRSMDVSETRVMDKEKIYFALTLTMISMKTTKQKLKTTQQNTAKMTRTKGPISQFIETNFLHFNAAALVDAAKAYNAQLASGAKMLVSLAGAMSTAELGKSFAEMIRQDKVQIISCTGANLEEDIMNLVAHSHYKRVPNYRDLTPQDECDLLEKGLNRVTDTCIPEEEAFRRLQKHIVKIWKDAEANGERFLPHEYMYKLLRSGVLEQYYEIDIKDSWMYAAAEKNIPIVCPGWEDSTMGNIFASYVLKGELKASTVKSGIEYMTFLADWYTDNSENGIGFFQIGGGIAGDFPICVVPMLYQDMERPETPFWSYFCQISDSTTSYGSYSGAVPNEKITWGKLDIDTPKFIIESDATIVAPLIFAYLLNM